MKQSIVMLVVAAVLAPAAVLGAQERGTTEIPRDARPPAGMCRIWLDNVPASQQPAPTDCATAVRNRPSNGRVLFGPERDEKAEPKKSEPKPKLPPFVRSFSPPASAPPAVEKKPAKKPDAP